MKPTDKPTCKSTSQKSVRLTKRPSAAPTQEPSESPVPEATDKPVRKLASSKSVRPTKQPSTVLTQEPSESPVPEATDKPTCKPFGVSKVLPAQPSVVSKSNPSTKPTRKPFPAKSTPKPTSKTAAVHRQLLESEEESLGSDIIQFESLIAISSLPSETTALEESLQAALTTAVDMALSLPVGSTTYMGDSLFVVENEQQSGVTLIAHIKTGVALTRLGTLHSGERSELFHQLRLGLGKVVHDGSLLKLFLDQTTLKSVSFGKSITSINLAVVPSSSKPSSSYISFLYDFLGSLQPFGMHSLYSRSNFSSIHVSVAVVVCLLLLFIGLHLVVSLAGRYQSKKLPQEATAVLELLKEKSREK